jgi:hypothetical protein
LALLGAYLARQPISSTTGIEQFFKLGDFVLNGGMQLFLTEHVCELPHHQENIGQFMNDGSTIHLAAGIVLERGDQFGAFFDGLIVLGFFPPSADGFSIDFLIAHHNEKALSGLDVGLPEP